MAETKDKLLERLNRAIEDCHKYKLKELSAIQVSELFTKLKSAIFSISIQNSPYLERLNDISNKFENTNAVHTLQRGYILSDLLGVAQSLKMDIDQGYFERITDLIHADSFADQFEIANELSGKGYKDAAAVVIGTTLELHLRNLCKKHGIQLYDSKGKLKNANALNTELYQTKIYSSSFHKRIIGWQDLRNKAAHGYYDDFSKEEVRLLIENIASFIQAYSA